MGSYPQGGGPSSHDSTENRNGNGQATATLPPPLSLKEQGAEFFRQIIGPPTETDGKPVGCVEVRILDADINKQNFVVKETRFPKIVSGYFTDVDSYLAALRQLKGVSAFVTVNPVNPALTGRIHNRLAITKQTTKDEDVVCLRFLFIDVDVKRPSGISSTAEELAAADERRNQILADHPDLAASAMSGCSGNGYWIVVRLPDYPNDEEHRAVIAATLDVFNARYSDNAISIDVSTKNPSRVMPAIPSIKCKGDSTPDRPHRRTTLDTLPLDIPPFDLVKWLAENETKPEPPVEADPRPTEPEKPADDRAWNGAHTSIKFATTIDDRIRKCLAACPPAIAGEKGHDKLLWAAGIGPGFALTEDETFNYLKSEYNPICVPVWSDKEILHKVKEAFRLNNKPLGHLRDAPLENGSATAEAIRREWDNAINAQPVNGQSANGTGTHHTYAPGDQVLAKDRGNFGTVIADLGSRVKVHFKSPDGYEATKTLEKSEVSPTSEKGKGDEEEPDYDSATPEQLGTADFADAEEENPEWLWEGRFLKRKINLIAGEGGDGKTTVAIMVGAIANVGGTFPDGSPSGEPGCVIVLAAEDGIGDTIKPRFRAAGANMERGNLIYMTAQVSIPKKGNRPAAVHPVCLQKTAYWRAILKRYRPKVLIIDPLPAYLGRGVNDHKNSEVQHALNEFAKVVAEFDVCVIAITHTGKSVDRKLIHKVLGSVAYTNVARLVHVTIRDPDDKTIRYLDRPKCNLDEPRDALVYRLVPVTYEHDGKTFKTTRAEFEKEAVAIDAEAMSNPKSDGPKRERDAKKETQVAEWLFDFLKDRTGWTEVRDIFAAAGEAELIGTFDKVKRRWSSGTKLYRAKDRIGELAEPREGHRIEDQDMATASDRYPRMCWRLVDDNVPF